MSQNIHVIRYMHKMQHNVQHKHCFHLDHDDIHKAMQRNVDAINLHSMVNKVWYIGQLPKTHDLKLEFHAQRNGISKWYQSCTKE